MKTIGLMDGTTSYGGTNSGYTGTQRQSLIVTHKGRNPLGVGNLLQAWSFSTFHLCSKLPTCRTSWQPDRSITTWQPKKFAWKLVGNPCCQPGLATSFQLVRLVGCGLNITVCTQKRRWRWTEDVKRQTSNRCEAAAYSISTAELCLWKKFCKI